MATAIDSKAPNTMTRQSPHLPTSACHRCGGLFIRESLFDLYDETGQMRRWALRCVQCGDVVDSLILKNRTLEELPNPQPEHRRRWAKMQSVSN